MATDQADSTGASNTASVTDSATVPEPSPGTASVDGHASAAATDPAVPLPINPKKKKVRHKASIYSPSAVLDPKFAKIILEMESALHCPVWMIVQNGEGVWRSIDDNVYLGFKAAAKNIEIGKKVALLIESPGGDAHHAYRIGRLFQRRASDFTVVVANFAKSAGTLLALAGSELILGIDAELGPLDVQMLDREREDFGSALDAVQALERLNAFSLTALDQTMQLLVRRTGKKVDSLLPHVLAYVTGFVKPLLEKIDTVDYTKKSRELKVAEEYATRLMRVKYDEGTARDIARKLVENYPTHGFVIDSEEASTESASMMDFGTGLKTSLIPPSLAGPLDDIMPYLHTITAIGRIEEVAV